MVHQDYKELLAAKALTALDAEDARALETHLESCVDCRAELVEWEQTAAFLAMDADPVEPSPELRQRILTSVSRAARDGEFAQTGTDSFATPSRQTTESRVLPFERPGARVSSWGSMQTIGAIAAGLALIALLASLVVLWQQNRESQSELARVSTQLLEANAQLSRQREAVALITSPGSRMAKLAGTKDAPGAHATLAYDQNGHAMLMAKGLPAVPKGMAYQLWFIKDNKKMPGKVFTPDTAGNGMLQDEIPSVAREAGVFAITLEPESGVKAPTGSIYLVSAI